MIERISRLRNCGVFQNFTWPQDLPNFGKFNLIYGWNGSGKTTLSRIFRDVQLRQVPDNGDAQLSITGSPVLRGTEFPNSSVSVRVFNRDFVEQNVFRADKGDVPPIFVLGQENVEKQKQVEELNEKLESAQSSLLTAKSGLEKSTRDFNAHCTEQGRVIRDMLFSSGGSIYNNYNRQGYIRRAEQMISDADITIHQISDEHRIQLRAQIAGNPKESIGKISYQIPNIKAMFDEVSELLSTTVISDAIQKLQNNAVLSRWVREGLDLHRNQNSVECLYCEQPIAPERTSALERHFNEAYEQLIQKLNSKINEISARKIETNIQLPQQAQFYIAIEQEYVTVCSKAEETLENIKEFLDSLLETLKNKKDRTFEATDMDVRAPDIDNQVINRVNEVILRHNTEHDNFQNNISKSKGQLEAGHIASRLSDFRKLKSDVHHYEEEVRKYENEIEVITAKITVLEHDIKQHHLPAEELNEDIGQYLGHKELQLEVKENGYVIVRNGTPAAALSEGESTAVALLYFLKSLKDTGFDLASGTVVLDDPVSSLDSNALYYALGFIQERTEQANQLLVLTHNFTFFRGVLNWFRYAPKNKQQSRFYMLDCATSNGLRQSSIKKLDSLLENYESDYHYLFARVYQGARSNSTSLEMNYNLPNMARRLLETFLAFRKPGSGELGTALRKVSLDTATRKRIDRFVNAYSHWRIVGEPDQNPFILGEAPSIFQDILDLIKTEDPTHYTEMEELAQMFP